MHYFIPPQTAFHQGKMKHLSFLWFLFRHPAGDSSQLAICHRMAASWTRVSAGEPFVFWNLHSAPSGYSSHPNLIHWSNVGCQHHICKYQICKYKNAKYLNLWAWFWHKKCTDISTPVVLPLWKTLPSLLWLSGREGIHKSFLLTAFLSTSFWGCFPSAVEVPTGDVPQETFRLLEQPYVEASVILEPEPKHGLFPLLGLQSCPSRKSDKRCPWEKSVVHKKSLGKKTNVNYIS